MLSFSWSSFPSIKLLKCNKIKLSPCESLVINMLQTVGKLHENVKPKIHENIAKALFENEPELTSSFQIYFYLINHQIDLNVGDVGYKQRWWPMLPTTINSQAPPKKESSWDERYARALNNQYAIEVEWLFNSSSQDHSHSPNRDHNHNQDRNRRNSKPSKWERKRERMIKIWIEIKMLWNRDHCWVQCEETYHFDCLKSFD